MQFIFDSIEELNEFNNAFVPRETGSAVPRETVKQEAIKEEPKQEEPKQEEPKQEEAPKAKTRSRASKVKEAPKQEEPKEDEETDIFAEDEEQKTPEVDFDELRTKIGALANSKATANKNFINPIREILASVGAKRPLDVADKDLQAVFDKIKAL